MTKLIGISLFNWHPWAFLYFHPSFLVIIKLTKKTIRYFNKYKI